MNGSIGWMVGTAVGQEMRDRREGESMYHKDEDSIMGWVRGGDDLATESLMRW
jgi:hypothetical protein